MIEEGRRIFRYDTFGSEAFWGDQLKLQQAIVGQKLGGIGAGVSPKMALSLGLKVDAEAVPPDLAAQIKAGKVDMDSPASTVALLKANSVVGVTAFLNQDGSVGLLAYSAPCVTQQSTTRSRRASAADSMAGAIAI
jgi:hypothetical protein